MVMAPVKIDLLLCRRLFIETAVTLVLFREIRPVSTVFIVVPSVVIFALFIVIAFLAMVVVVGTQSYGCCQSGAENKRA